jgi:hypothetical protein
MAQDNPVTTGADRRSQVKARLAEKSRRITDRFEVFESGAGSSPVAVASRMLSRKSVRIGLAAGAGALVGLWLMTRSRKTSAPWDDGVDELADRLAKSVAKRVEKGDDLKDAVRKAVHQNPPVLHLEEKHGIFREAISQLSRVLSSALVKEVTRQVSSYLDRRKDSE